MAKGKKLDVKSRAEIQHAYRQRQKEKNSEASLLKERLRWKKRRESQKIQLIGDLGDRDKRVLRRRWRLQRANSRNKQKIAAAAIEQTMPQFKIAKPYSERTDRGRKKVAYQKTKANRLIIMLEDRLDEETRLRKKYMKRCERLKEQINNHSNSVSDSVTPAIKPASSSSNSKLWPLSSTGGECSTPRTKTRLLLRGVSRVSPAVRKTLLYHNVVMYRDEGKEKRPSHVLNAVHRNILKKYRLSNFARESKLPQSKAKELKSGVHQQRSDAVTDITRGIVTDFYERDDNSRITTGKKQTITRQKEKKQKRLLLDIIVNLHHKFSSESTDNIMSYVAFSRLRPFWVCQPTAKDRDTCLCKKHDNIQLMADKLHQLKVLSSKHCEELLATICCDVNSRSCMFRECKQCCSRSMEYRLAEVPKDSSVVFWYQWETSHQEYEKNGISKTAKVIVKKMKHGSLGELKEQFNGAMCNELSRHVYIIRHQFRAYRSLKENLKSNEAVIHVDFSENYNCKHSAEIQACHFGASNQQATIHTGVLYRAQGLQSFATIFNSYRHDPLAIWEHLQPILFDMRQKNPEITDLHLFSDGPTTQYRNKQNFYLLCTKIYCLGFERASWNFFESGHGKGAPDAIGGSLKRKADRIVNMGSDIRNASELFCQLEKEESHTKLYFIDGAHIDALEKTCCPQLQVVKGTMKLHQLYTNRNLQLSYRSLSCFCKRPAVCKCYDLQKRTFPAIVQPKCPPIVQPETFPTVQPENRSMVQHETIPMVQAETCSMVQPEALSIVQPATISARNIDLTLSTKSFYRKHRKIGSEERLPGTIDQGHGKRSKRIPSRYMW